VSKSKFKNQRDIAVVLRSLDSLSSLEECIASLQDDDAVALLTAFSIACLATQPGVLARNVWGLNEAPTHIRALVTDDEPIDGIIETMSGEIVGYAIDWCLEEEALADDERFVALSEAGDFDRVALITNAIAVEVDLDCEYFVIRRADLERLRSDDFETIAHWLETGEIVRNKKEPYPHQREAIDALTSAFDEADRATAVLACGSGKTLVQLWLAEEMGAKTVLVLVPSLALVRQSLHEWLGETSLMSLRYLCVCSDKTVAEGDETHLTQADLDFPVTTDSEAVRNFLTGSNGEVKIIFSTYQSAAVVADGMGDGFSFGLGIFDEAHKTTGEKGKQFSFALEESNIAIDKRAFFTATPRHYALPKGDDAPTLTYSMDDPDVYGQAVYTLSFREAVNRGVISDYRILISVVTSGMLDAFDLQEGGAVVFIDGQRIPASVIAHQIALQQAVEQYGIRKVFTFHRSVATAERFTGTEKASVIHRLVDFRSFHVNGRMNTATRDGLMTNFRRAVRAIMSNARCLTEGVDVPDVDMVAFLTRKRSVVDIVQATGRAMRKAEGKECGYVLVPLYVEQEAGETVEEAVARADFKTVWEILNALREQDDVLADVLRRLRRGTDDWEPPGDGGGWSDIVDIIGPSVSIDDLHDAISLICVNALTTTWDQRYNELVAYRARFGHCRVPARWAENLALGTWVSNQRSRYAMGKIEPSRIQLLEALGFEWSLTRRTAWSDRFEQLKIYRERFGNCRVPYNWTETPQLARWVVKQRHAHSKGKLSPERVRLLEAIGFEWVLTVWGGHYKNLKAYGERFGNCRVPRNWAEDPQLGTWVVNQRGLYYQGRLSAERIKLLEAIGFEWAVSTALPWEDRFEQLKAYKERFGNCRVPRKWAENTQLGSWVHIQRGQYSKGKLSPERVALLEAVGFVWSRSRGAKKKSQDKSKK